MGLSLQTGLVCGGVSGEALNVGLYDRLNARLNGKKNLA
jgi:hypothetical protein